MSIIPYIAMNSFIFLSVELSSSYISMNTFPNASIFIKSGSNESVFKIVFKLTMCGGRLSILAIKVKHGSSTELPGDANCGFIR